MQCYCVLVSGGQETQRYTQEEKAIVMTEAEIGAMQSKTRNTNNCQPTPKAKNRQGEILCRVSEGHSSADTLTSDHQPPEL